MSFIRPGNDAELSEQPGSQMLPRWEQSMHGPSLTDDAPIAHRTTPWELKRHVCLRLLGLNSTYRLPADNPSGKFPGRNIGLSGVDTYQRHQQERTLKECTNC